MLYYKIKITATNPSRTVERQIVTELVTKHCVHVLGGEQDTQAAKTSSPSHLWAVGQQRWGVLQLGWGEARPLTRSSGDDWRSLETSPGR